MPVRAVFEAPTVVALAQRVEQALRQRGRDASCHRWWPWSVRRRSPSPLPSSDSGSWISWSQSSTAYLIPSAQRLQGDVNVTDLERSLEELVHGMRVCARPLSCKREQPVQVIHPPELLCGTSDRPARALAGAQRAAGHRALLQQEAEHPCDLERGPLLRMALLRLEPQEHVLLLTLHHIITDGWSKRSWCTN